MWILMQLNTAKGRSGLGSDAGKAGRSKSKDQIIGGNVQETERDNPKAGEGEDRESETEYEGSTVGCWEKLTQRF